MPSALFAAAIATLAVASSGAAGASTFDGYAFGMTIAQAEGVAPKRKTFECGRLMTSRCIVYRRRLGTLDGTVTIQFSLDEHRIDRIEMSPIAMSGRGGKSCDAAWSGLVAFLKDVYGPPQSQEGNTVYWRADNTAVTATVLQEEGEFCDVAAALTSADSP
jgi:hypothetical protein